jgi:uncharacterized protein YdaU (DUF1376 family)
MAEFPAIPLWTDAYLADTTHLTRAEHGSYLLLLMHMWRAPEGKIPNDDGWIAKRLRCSVEEVQSEVRPLIAEFCQTDGNWIWQKRLLDELAWVRKKQRRNSVSAKARWNNKKPDTNASFTHSERNAPTPTPTPTEERIATAIPKKEARSRGTRLEQSWKPSEEAIQFAWGLGLDPEREAGEFRDYWIGVPGQRGVKLDWEATWRNHCRRSKKLAGRGGKPSGPTGFNALLFDEIGGRGFGPLDEARQPDGGGDTIIEGVAFTRRGAA